MPVEPVKSRRLYQDVADQLSRLISEGEFKPGERLPSERELAVSFRVSRPTIREAMMALELSGAIEIRTGSGNFVLDPNAPTVNQDAGPGPFELIEARIHIEGETAALAAMRIDDEQIVLLKNAVEEMERQAALHMPADQADRRFHQVIAQATRNSAMVAAVDQLWDFRSRMPMWQKLHDIIRDIESREDWTDDARSASDHWEIIDALRSRQPDRARHVMQAHLQRVRDVLLKASEFEDMRSNAEPALMGSEE